MYHWIITDDNDNYGGVSAVGTDGPRNANLEAHMKHKFRLLCEGDIIYEGLIGGEFDGFEPLDDFGSPNFGCDEIEYFNNGKWEIL